jgi:SAM-dependent methyltransferase
MRSKLKLTSDAIEMLRCPRCHADLAHVDDQLKCAAFECQLQFPILDGIPVVIDEAASVFTVDDFVSNRMTTLLRARPGPIKNAIEKVLGTERYSWLKRTVRAGLPDISKNISGEMNYARLGALLIKRSGSLRVLVLGGGILGDGIQALMRHTSIEFIESDVSFGPRTKLICDAHDIPFRDGTFDGVIAQAVLEHVVDPYRCVAEIHRVLKDNGLVYAETPFIQQVHAGRYDFTRFTHLGHRRLFRKFVEVDSGAVCGPGMALAWSYQYFLTSFVTSQKLRSVLRLFASFTSFFLKYFDYFLVSKKGAYDAASGFYFLGSRASHSLSDKELITLYRGLDSL